jgi:hypothetical protein
MTKYARPLHWHRRGGFALVWAWGIGGVTGSTLIGKPLDRVGPTPLLIRAPQPPQRT